MTIRKEFFAGTFINNACQEAVSLAIKENDWVEFEFNGITLIATPETKYDSLIDKWYELVKKRSDEYWTPEKLKEKEDRKEKDRQILKLHFAEFKNVLSLLDLLDWFCKLSDVSFTHASISQEEKIEVLKKCEFFEVYPNMNCQKPNETHEEWESNSNDYKLKWLLGQALDGTMSIGCPHPMIQNWAKLWV